MEDGGGGSDDVKIVENGIDHDGKEVTKEATKSSKQKSGNSQPTSIEPSIFTCGTCKSVYSSSWFLVQHVQKTHGLKIYEEPRDCSPPPPSSVPTRPIVVQPDKLLSEHLRTGKDSPAVGGPASLSSPFHKSAGSRHRSPTCSPRTGSGGSGDMFSFPTPPFMPGAPRQPSCSSNSPATWPYARSPIMSDFAMMHPELVMDQLRRIKGLVGAADHPAIPGMSPFLRPPLDASPGGQYSHSERLRLLAATGGGSTSPKHPPQSRSSKLDTASKSFTSPTQQHQSTPPSAFTTPTTTTSALSSHDTTTTTPSLMSSVVAGGRQQQLKQCEFCNKQFRFASNLVLHRRLHTGERPYTCPLCTFTSAQATKLRKHMRSHVTSPADTSADPYKFMDSDIEDTEEFVQREADAEAAIRQLEREAKQHKEDESQSQQADDEPTDLSSNGRHSVDSASPAPPSSHADNNDDEDIITDRASLLSEVMMKTGLSSLPNYKEAFTAALAEANNAKSPQRHSPKPATPSSKDDKTETIVPSPVKQEPLDHDDSVKDYTDGEVEEENDESVNDDVSVSSQRRSPQSRASSDFSSTEQPPEKRIKRESSPLATALARSPSSSTFPGADHLFQRAAMEAAATHSIYPGLWFPQTTSAGGLPFSPFMGRGEHTAAAMMSAAAASSRLQAAAAAATTSENGLSPQASSAFSNNGSPKLPSPDPSGMGSLTQGSVRRRNDTCEFCGKIFKNCSNLTVHRRSHTGEKPYKCQLCPYACAQSSKLTRHMRTHGRHGKDVYRCKFCCMPFSVPSTLEKHMRKCVESQQRAAAARHLGSPLTAPVV